jgi:hypothetical protein
MPKVKLLTKAIEKALPLLGSTEGKAPEKIKIPLKIFNPYGAGTWYIWERDPETNLCFGCAQILEAELGYIDLNELIDLQTAPGLYLERDYHWEGTVQDIAKEYHFDFLVK